MMDCLCDKPHGVFAMCLPLQLTFNYSSLALK
jgi:hypothetical protein